jgi:tetratricopeptide (TPR) repeat protein
MLSPAIEFYTRSRAAFTETEGREDEYAMMLNNLAHGHAQLGRFLQARSLAYEALRTASDLGNRYVEGLTRAVLADIATLRGSYDRAIQYGEDALGLFQEIGDPFGESMVRLALAKTHRWAGIHEAKKGFDVELALHHFDRAQVHVETARGLGLRLRSIDTEEALIHKERGKTLLRQAGIEKALPELRQAEGQIKALLQSGLDQRLPSIERANLLDSLAQIRYATQDVEGAEALLRELVQVFGPAYQIVPGEQLPLDTAMDAAFYPLCKAEWLRLQMALDAGQIERAVAHLSLAYAYACHYSPQTILLQFILDDLYSDYLSHAGAAERVRFMELLREETYQDFGVNMTPLFETLQDLA